MREEIFGPAMPIMTFKSVDEALVLANDGKYGLTAALYNTNYRTAMRFANEIETGLTGKPANLKLRLVERINL